MSWSANRIHFAGTCASRDDCNGRVFPAIGFLMAFCASGPRAKNPVLQTSRQELTVIQTEE
jgi:hypothetical protein